MIEDEIVDLKDLLDNIVSWRNTLVAGTRKAYNDRHVFSYANRPSPLQPVKAWKERRGVWEMPVAYEEGNESVQVLRCPSYGEL